MKRPRQNDNDCVIAVFREITGEDENTAFARFHSHVIKGEAGFSEAALISCLMDAGWMCAANNYLAEHVAGSNGGLSDTESKAYWTHFQGEDVVFYTTGDAKIGHAILVRSGGIVFDPSAPENGEFIVDHLRRVGRKNTIKSVLTVTRMRQD